MKVTVGGQRPGLIIKDEVQIVDRLLEDCVGKDEIRKIFCSVFFLMKIVLIENRY